MISRGVMLRRSWAKFVCGAALAALAVGSGTLAAESAGEPAPYGAVPSERQLGWHKLELYGFVHFTVNTFTGKEWGYGDEDPAVFNPTDFDAAQIARAAKAAGLRGLILTAKHHDGFCLWPSRYTEHSIAHSPYRGGKGDIVGELAAACRTEGVKFGIYLSPWDRNRADYGQASYLEYYRAQLTELLTNYGELFEVWFDGANGGDGYYGGAREKRTIDAKSYYGWEETWALVRRLQPRAAMFSDGGPDVRWVGNERGEAGEPCWATLQAADFPPGGSDTHRLNTGDRGGAQWVPAECDVSIRPGWFYHAEEDARVRTPENLVDLYFASVGRGGSLLLNLPPDRRGRIPDQDIAALRGFRERREAIFREDLAKTATVSASQVRRGDGRFAAAGLVDQDQETFWATDDAVTSAEVMVDFGREATFSVVSLREAIRLGQRVERFAIDVWRGDRWTEIAHGTSIGARRIVRFAPVTANRLRVRLEAPVPLAVSELAVYREP